MWLMGYRLDGDMDVRLRLFSVRYRRVVISDFE